MKWFGAHAAMLGVLLLTACKKEDKGSNGDGCEKGNYGMLHVSFGATNVRHSILVTMPDKTAREKISGIGKTSDTMHLKPGSYVLSVASIDDEGRALDQESKSAVITQCDNSDLSVAF